MTSGLLPVPVDFVTLLCLTLFELGHPSTESETFFDLVSDVGSVRAPSAARSETRESILPPCPAKFLRDSSRLCGSSWIGRDRLDRAWTAGNWAKAVLAKRIGSPNRTPPLDLRPWALGSYLGSYHFPMSMKPECIWKHPASQIDPLLPEGPNGDSDSYDCGLSCNHLSGHRALRVGMAGLGVKAERFWFWCCSIVSEVSWQPFQLDFCRKRFLPSGTGKLRLVLSVRLYTVLVVPLMVLDNGVLAPTGVSASVLVVDFTKMLPISSGCLQNSTPFSSLSISINPLVFLLLQNCSQKSRTGWSVGSAVETLTSLPFRPQKRWMASNPQAPGHERHTSATKKLTVATLASAMQQLLETNRGMSTQLQSLTQRPTASNRAAVGSFAVSV